MAIISLFCNVFSDSGTCFICSTKEARSVDSIRCEYFFLIIIYQRVYNHLIHVLPEALQLKWLRWNWFRDSVSIFLLRALNWSSMFLSRGSWALWCFGHIFQPSSDLTYLLNWLWGKWNTLVRTPGKFDSKVSTMPQVCLKPWVEMDWFIPITTG